MTVLSMTVLMAAVLLTAHVSAFARATQLCLASTTSSTYTRK